MSEEALGHFDTTSPARESACRTDGGKKAPVPVTPSHNVMIGAQRTSVRLDQVSLLALEDIARREGMDKNALCTLIDTNNEDRRLTFSATLRTFILSYYIMIATDDGHQRAGHGAKPANLTSESIGEQKSAALNKLTKAVVRRGSLAS